LAAIRTNYSPEEFTISLGDSVIGDYTPGSYDFQQQTTASIVATSTSETLLFQSVSPTGGDPADRDSVVDLVNIVAVAPEPGTSGLLIAAAGIMAFSIRRRRGTLSSRS
jgi:hypothetical protein